MHKVAQKLLARVENNETGWAGGDLNPLPSLKKRLIHSTYLLALTLANFTKTRIIILISNRRVDIQVLLHKIDLVHGQHVGIAVGSSASQCDPWVHSCVRQDSGADISRS